MLTFILLAALAIVVIFGGVVAYSANQRKRSGQSGKAAVNEQQSDRGTPRVGRSTGVN